MNTNQTPHLLSLDCSDTASPSEHKFTDNEAQQFVRHDPESLASLSDSALDEYIVSCAERCNAAHARYKATGCFGDAGERDSWWTAEAAALVERGSRPGVVARMERERGLT